MLTEKFLDSLEKHRPYHRLAWDAGLTPNQLYRITAGIDRPGRSDPRIPKLARILGMDLSECFEVEDRNEN